MKIKSALGLLSIGVFVLTIAALHEKLKNQDASSSSAPGAVRRVDSEMLSENYSKAAMLSLFAIQSDLFVSDPNEKERMVDKDTQAKINTADVEAITSEELQITELLRNVYLRKLNDNWSRKAGGDLLAASRNLHAQEIADGFRVTDSRERISDIARTNEIDEANRLNEQRDCFSLLMQSLRDRNPQTPEPCTKWIASWNAKSEKADKLNEDQAKTFNQTTELHTQQINKALENAMKGAAAAVRESDAISRVADVQQKLNDVNEAYLKSIPDSTKILEGIPLAVPSPNAHTNISAASKNDAGAQK